MPNQQQQRDRRERRQRERERAREMAQEREAERQAQRAERDLAEQADVDEDEVTRDDGEVRLTEDGQETVRQRQLRESATEFDEEIDDRDITPGDVEIAGEEVRLRDSVREEIQDDREREATEALDEQIDDRDITRDDVAFEDGEVRLRDSVSDDIEADRREQAAEAIDDEVDDRDIDTDDITDEDGEWVLRDSVRDDIQSEREQEAIEEAAADYPDLDERDFFINDDGQVQMTTYGQRVVGASYDRHIEVEDVSIDDGQVVVDEDAQFEADVARLDQRTEVELEEEHIERTDEGVALTDEFERDRADFDRRQAAAELDQEITAVDVTDRELVEADGQLQLDDDTRREVAAAELDQEITAVDVTDRDLVEADGQWQLDDDTRREVAAAELDGEIDDTDITADDILEDGDGWGLDEDAQLEVAAERAGSDVEPEDLTVTTEGEIVHRDATGADFRTGTVSGGLGVSGAQVSAQIDELTDTRDARLQQEEAVADAVATDLDAQTDLTVSGPGESQIRDPTVESGPPQLDAGSGAAEVQITTDDVSVDGELSDDVLDRIQDVERERAEAEVAADLDLSPQEIDIVTVESEQAVPSASGPTTESQQELQISAEGQEELLERELVEEEGLDRDEFEIVREDGDVSVEVQEDPDGWLEQQAQRWDEDVAAPVGSAVETVTPGVDMASFGPTPAGTQQPRTGFQTDEFMGQFATGATEAVNPPGIAQLGVDGGAAGVSLTSDQLGARRDAVERLAERDSEDITEDPQSFALDVSEASSPIPPNWTAEQSGRARVMAGDAAIEAATTSREDPFGSVARGGGFAAGALVGGPAAVRGGRAVRSRSRDLDLNVETSNLRFSSDDRAQLDFAGRQRQREPTDVDISPQQTSPDFDPRVTESVGRRQPGQVADTDALVPEIGPGGPRATVSERRAFAQRVRDSRAPDVRTAGGLSSPDLAGGLIGARGISDSEILEPEVTPFDQPQELERQAENLTGFVSDEATTPTQLQQQQQRNRQGIRSGSEIWSDSVSEMPGSEIAALDDLTISRESPTQMGRVGSRGRASTQSRVGTTTDVQTMQRSATDSMTDFGRVTQPRPPRSPRRTRGAPRIRLGEGLPDDSTQDFEGSEFDSAGWQTGIATAEDVIDDGALDFETDSQDDGWF